MDYQTYDRHGLLFHYPYNWLLEESEEMSPIRGALQLTGPSGAFWILNIHPFGSSPDAIARNVLKTMRQEYANLEHEPVFKVLFGRELCGYEMHFFYLDLTSSATVLCYADETATYSLFWQSGDQMVLTGREEEVSVEQVFEAITYTLLQHSADSPAR